jgi:hypothetical protein
MESSRPGDRLKEIPLTQGKIALVDDEDYPYLSAFNWCATKDRNKWYAVRSFRRNGKQVRVRMHMVILKAPAGLEVDHKNGNGLDNRRDNLRLATRSQNKRNGIKLEGTSSIYKGVSWRKNLGKWQAIIYLPKLTYLGSFNDEIEAARAYDAAAREHFGEFARLNFPQ